MKYRVEFRQAAAGQTIGLPPAAFTELARALGIASRDPFDDNATLATPDVHVRRVMSGGSGLASFYIDAGRELISASDVTWAG